jgi:hypothetical protein
MKPIGDVTQNMTTLSECVTNALESGYVENFKVESKGLLTADGKSIYQPQDITIANFYRFEGYTNPDDNSILYLVVTNDGRKGTLIDAYGAYADAEFSDFIRQVDEIHKRKEN